MGGGGVSVNMSDSLISEIIFIYYFINNYKTIFVFPIFNNLYLYKKHSHANRKIENMVKINEIFW